MHRHAQTLTRKLDTHGREASQSVYTTYELKVPLLALLSTCVRVRACACVSACVWYAIYGGYGGGGTAQIISIVLPLPIILCQGCIGQVPDTPDGCMMWPEMVLAFALPAGANIVIGNVIEPLVFGKALNLTVASVLFSLFFWTSLWGISGAILSVPFLSLMKILLIEADHPLCARLVEWIRDDPEVDEARELERQKKHRSLLINMVSVCMAHGSPPLAVSRWLTVR